MHNQIGALISIPIQSIKTNDLVRIMVEVQKHGQKLVNIYCS